MTTFTIPYEGEPLIKAKPPKTKPLKQNLGSWQGLPIVAIGKRNGKIVGYDSKGQPIYASSPKAKKLAAIKKQEGTDKSDHTGEWLLALGIPNKIKDVDVYVQPESAKLLEDHFPDLIGTKVGGAFKFSFTELYAHVGEPLTPKEEQKEGWAAGIAAGESGKDDPFPDLSTLKEIDAGKFAGSQYHGANRLFEDPSGQKWVFKDKDPTIARAEEAASRLGRLLMGDKIPPARVVEIAGKSGALIKVLSGDELPKSVSLQSLEDYHRDIAKHFVVDWLISNHDAHGGNFIGKGGQLQGIDKGQAWKFFGKDPLDHNYSPNEHDPIYKKFWNAVQDGLIDLSSIATAMGEVLDKADTVSSDQFRAIVAPYVTTAAPHAKFDPEVRAKAMTARKEMLREDMKAFLAALMGKTVAIPKQSADNFETMPEAEGLAGQKLTIQVPDKPEVIEGGPKAPVDTSGTTPAGWPQTKGKVTIHHPGEPSPGGKWPKGYPGPGFKASIIYKKQNFTVEFSAGPTVDVYYPDGTKKSWPSPNAASESMALYTKGLPMDMSSTEKQKQGISLPAKKFFGITSFKNELAEAHTGEVAPSAMNPQELEDAGVIQKNAPELSAETVIGKLPDGAVEDWDDLPAEIKEALVANEFEFGTDYTAALPPGIPFKVTYAGKPTIFLAEKSAPENVGYLSFKWEDGKLVSGSTSAALADLWFGLDENAELAGIKKQLAHPDVPQTADEKIGAAPDVELPKEAKVPADAPKHYKGPLAPGTSITIQKKFPWGKSDVMLMAGDESFDVVFMDAESTAQTKTVQSISEANNWITVNQKGYPDVETYKKATGKKKPPSNGWAFWGLKAKPQPEPSMEPPKTAEGQPGLISLDEFPVDYSLMAYPVGTVLVWQQGTEVFKAKKTAADNWAVTGSKGTVDLSNAGFAHAGPGTTNVKIKVAEAPKVDPLWTTFMGEGATIAPEAPLPPVEAAPTPSAPNWETMPEVTKEAIATVPEGTLFKFSGAGKGWTGKKVGMDQYELTAPSGNSYQRSLDLFYEQISKGSAGVEIKKPVTAQAPPPVPEPSMPPAIEGYADPIEGMPTKWSKFDLPNLQDWVMNHAPEGTQFKVGGDLWVKNKQGNWDNINSPGEQASSKYLPALLEGKDFLWRVMDHEQFSAQIKGEVEPKPIPTPIKPVVAPEPEVELTGPQEISAFTKPVKEAIVGMPIGSKLTWTEWGNENYMIQRTAVGYNVFDMFNKQLATDTDAATAFGYVSFTSNPSDFVLTPAEVGAPVGVTPAEPTKVSVPSIKGSVQKTISEMKPGDVLVWDEDGVGFMLQKKNDGSFTVNNLDDGLLIDSGMSEKDAFGQFDWNTSVTDIFWTKAPAPAPAAPSEENWETMPESGDSGQYTKMLAALPIGTELKWTSKSSGQGWTAIKTSDINFQLTTPYGKLLTRNEVSLGQFLMLMEGIQTKKPAGAIADPFKIMLAEADKPKPAPPKKEPTPKPEKTAEQKAKEKQAEETAKWLKKNKPVTDGKTLQVLAHVQDEWLSLYSPGMHAWARKGPKGTVLLGSPHPEFATLINDLQNPKSGKPLPMKKVKSPLGDFWKMKVDDIVEHLPGDVGETVVGPDGIDYPKGTTWTSSDVSHQVIDLLKNEPGFYKIVEHNTDPNTLLLKVAGSSEAKKKQLLDMAKKYGLTHDEPVKGGANWILFVKQAELAKIGKEETIYEAKTPPQPDPFISAPLPTLATAKPGQIGTSNRADLAAIKDIEIGKFGHSVRMGAAGTFKNSQVHVRKVKAADGKVYYEVRGELEDFNPDNSLLGYKTGSLPSAMTQKNPGSDAFHLHSFEGGIHDESGNLGGTITSVGGYGTTSLKGTDVHVYTEQQSLKNTFTVRIPEALNVEDELRESLEAMGLDPNAAMREQTADDERISIKSAIVKSMLGPEAWMKGTANKVFPADKRNDEAWLDKRLQDLNVTPEMVASARFETTFDNHQSVVFDDPTIQKSQKAKFVYMGMSEAGVFFQIKDGSGWSSRTTRYLNGIEQSGASAESDMTKGGANGAFARIGYSGHSSDWGLKCEGWKVLFNKRVLDRTDWRFYQADSYGETRYEDKDMRRRQGVTEAMQVSNEVVFDEGIAVRDIGGILAPNNFAREKMIDKFKAEGITELNGIPMEELIQVQFTGSRTQAAKQFAGLKKKGIP